MKQIDIKGKKFGRLIVTNYMQGGDWFCVCKCGFFTLAKSGHLRSGATRSCGCLQKETRIRNGQKKKTHGMDGTPTYWIWQGLRRRCYDPKTKGYKYYGGRGIKFCKRWERFENFYADMGERPPGLSIDRINNDGNYGPANCRWATITEQNNNRRNCKWPL